MRTIDLIDKLHNDEMLRQLVDAGVITINVISWRKIYHLYTDRLAAGRKKYDAVHDVCDTFDISYTTFYRIKKNMECE